MKKGVGCWALISFFLVFLLCSPALAKEKEKGQSKDAPSGWDKGEKKGWHSDVPPGSEKKGESKPPDLNEDEHGSTKTKKGKKEKKEAGEEVVDTEGKAKEPEDREENKTKEDVKEADKEMDAEDQEVNKKTRKKEEHKKGRRHKESE